MFISPAVLLLFALAAALYAMAGHGGGSAYLALMSLLEWPREEMRGTALALNLVVSGIAWAMFLSRGGFPWRLFACCACGGIPAAWIGGKLGAPAPVFWGVIAAALLVAAYRTAFSLGGRDAEASTPVRDYSPPVWIGLGAVLGLLAGACGIGGGVFLGPLLLLTRTTTAFRAAAISAAYIFVNSASGLLATAFPAGWSPPWALMATVAVAGWAGSWVGSRRASPLMLRRALAVALTLAAGKCLLNAF